MAKDNTNLDHTNSDREESAPLLLKDLQENDKKPAKLPYVAAVTPPLIGHGGRADYGWTANGLPLVHGSVVGEPMGRTQWNSCLFACFGRADDFCSSDLEVCLLGSVAPCVLYGSNAERLGASPGTFMDHCLPYCGLYLIGEALFARNCIAPCFSYPNRTAMRRKFNLEGGCEALHGLCGCCGSCVEDESQREACESACDCATHLFCHQCALCQEGREIRRRMPHPGFNAQPVLVMIPPREQAMGR